MSFSMAYRRTSPGIGIIDDATDQQWSQQMINDWLKRKEQMEALTRPPQPKNLPIDPRNQGVGDVVNDPASILPLVTAGAANNQAAMQTAATTPVAGANANGTGSGSISDNLEVKPGRYYSEVTPVNINSLIQDPNQALNYWSRFQGYNDAYGKRMAGTFNFPGLLRAMGIGQGNNGAQLTGTDALDWYGRLADRMSGRLTDNGNYQYLDPTSIVASIFNTPKFQLGSNAGVSDLSLQINNPGLQPEEQVYNVAEYVIGALQGVLTNEQLEAYAQIIDQFATEFMRQAQTTPGGTGDLTFLEFLRQNTGQFGGLF